MRALRGVIPPLVTPLTADGAVDVTGLVRITEFQLGAGVHGLFVLGSTGEAPYLSDAQREQVVDVVRGVNAGQVPLLIGAIDTAGERVIDQAVRAERAGADLIVITPPFFGLVSDVEVREHYLRVAQRLSIPIVMYHIPTRTGGPIGVSVMADLAESGTIVAVKDSGPDFGAFRQLLLATRQLEGFSAFTGSELLVDAAILAGAHGVMPGLANLDPHGFVRLYDAASRGDWNAAVTEQSRLARLLLVVEDGPRRAGADGRALLAFKEAMRQRGLIDSTHTLATNVAMTESGARGVHRRLVDAELATFAPSS